MMARLIPVLRALCVALLLPLAVSAGVAPHGHDTCPTCDMPGLSEATMAQDAAPNVGMHCAMGACVALLPAGAPAPLSGPLLSPPFGSARSATAPLYRAEGPERPPNL